MIRKMVLVPYDRWCNTKPKDDTPPPPDPITLPPDPKPQNVSTQTEQVGGTVRPPPGLPIKRKRTTIKWIKH